MSLSSSSSSSSSSYKKIDNLINGTDDLEKSSFIKQQQQQQKPAKKTNYGSLRTDIQQTQTAKVFLINYKHRITKGETLQGISLKYNIPVSRKKKENFIDFSCISRNKFIFNDLYINSFDFKLRINIKKKVNYK